ncbi:hypothetical protein CYMTET_48355 [Cymbomonas tetramitiformis]|uniref:Uncharacterized protein n=1 Tax=Cymbomonas tetramitiformis TaxID=36881 RepID=A0AAE0BSJ8_9CHLO|nr:hypothetical protein CYMTET_48355 [Cymbomonas tetramitiformis]
MDAKQHGCTPHLGARGRYSYLNRCNPKKGYSPVSHLHGKRELCDPAEPELAVRVSQLRTVQCWRLHHLGVEAGRGAICYAHAYVFTSPAALSATVAPASASWLATSTSPLPPFSFSPPPPSPPLPPSPPPSPPSPPPPEGAFSVDFDGVDDYLLLPEVSNIQSVSLWFIKSSTQPQATHYLIDARTGASDGYLSNNNLGEDWMAIYMDGQELFSTVPPPPPSPPPPPLPHPFRNLLPTSATPASYLPTSTPTTPGPPPAPPTSSPYSSSSPGLTLSTAPHVSTLTATLLTFIPPAFASSRR